MEESEEKAMVRKWRMLTRLRVSPPAMAMVKLSMARAMAVSQISRMVMLNVER